MRGRPAPADATRSFVLCLAPAFEWSIVLLRCWGQAARSNERNLIEWGYTYGAPLQGPRKVEEPQRPNANKDETGRTSLEQSETVDARRTVEGPALRAAVALAGLSI